MFKKIGLFWPLGAVLSVQCLLAQGSTVLKEMRSTSILVRELVLTTKNGVLPDVSAVFNEFDKECAHRYFCRLDVATHRHFLLRGNMADASLEGIRKMTVMQQESGRVLAEWVRLGPWKWIRETRQRSDSVFSPGDEFLAGIGLAQIRHAGFEGRIVYVNLSEQSGEPLLQLFAAGNREVNVQTLSRVFEWMKLARGDASVKLSMLVSRDGWFPHILGYPLSYQFVDVSRPSIIRDFETGREISCVEGLLVECSERPRQ